MKHEQNQPVMVMVILSVLVWTYSFHQLVICKWNSYNVVENPFTYFVTSMAAFSSYFMNTITLSFVFDSDLLSVICMSSASGCRD